MMRKYQNPQMVMKVKIRTLMKVCGYTSEEYAQSVYRNQDRIIQQARYGVVPLYIRASRKLKTSEMFILATTQPDVKLHSQDPRNKYIKFIDKSTGKKCGYLSGRKWKLEPKKNMNNTCSGMPRRGGNKELRKAMKKTVKKNH